ncbi:MAG: aminodeoxychorismate lyase [Gammaproteobacteria bacterium]|nr:MAG: aminodeoxychorismate lyase [Gammaproteobacteria bacterium]
MWLIDGRRARSVPVGDRGLQYGDGLFETLAVVDGRVRLLPLHLARLAEGCRRLRLPAPPADLLAGELGRLARGQVRAVLKLIVTRGDGQRGYAPPQPTQPRRLLGRFAWPAWSRSHYTHGVAVRVCETRLGPNPALAGIKHLNRLEQVLARAEWRDARWQEGLMLDDGRRVVCGTMSNVFAVREGCLETPSLARCGVAGVMRGMVQREAARLGLPSREGELDLDALAAADELFLTNAIIGIWPIRRLGALTLRRGPVTRALQAALAEQGVSP